MSLPVLGLITMLTVVQTPPQSQTVPPTVTAPTATTQTGQPTGEVTLQGVDVRASTTQVDASPRRVCRTEPVTGSRFGRQVCRNAQETEADRAEARQQLQRMQGLRRAD